MNFGPRTCLVPVWDLDREWALKKLALGVSSERFTQGGTEDSNRRKPAKTKETPALASPIHRPYGTEYTIASRYGNKSKRSLAFGGGEGGISGHTPSEQGTGEDGWQIFSNKSSTNVGGTGPLVTRGCAAPLQPTDFPS